jgi:hypothetical protein
MALVHSLDILSTRQTVELRYPETRPAKTFHRRLSWLDRCSTARDKAGAFLG